MNLLTDCLPCRGTGVLRHIDLTALLLSAHLPETEQPWEAGPCPICDGKGASVRVSSC